MEELTCPNCHVDVDPEELKRNHLRCRTCGHDMTESEDTEDVEDGEEEEAEESDEEEQKE